MKKKIFLILVLGFFSFAFSAFAHENESSNTSQQSRIYIQLDQIHVNDEGLFVELDGNTYQVAQICQDEKGFFVPKVEFWVLCPQGHPNPPWRFTCQVCGLAL